MITNAVLELARLAQEMADRYERLAPDADGNTDPIDKKMLADIRTQIEIIVTHPRVKAFKQSEKSSPEISATAKEQKSTRNFATDYFDFSQDTIYGWESVYSGLDVSKELENIAAWLDANPDSLPENNQKFVIQWLDREHRKLSERQSRQNA